MYYPGQARLEIYGEKGTLFVPDPNGFGGPVSIFRPGDREPQDVPLAFDYAENSRALGLADMAKAVETGRFCRTDYRQTRHVLEIMTAFEKSSDAGSICPITTHYDRKPPMKNNPVHGVLD